MMCLSFTQKEKGRGGEERRGMRNVMRNEVKNELEYVLKSLLFLQRLFVFYFYRDVLT